LSRGANSKISTHLNIMSLLDYHDAVLYESDVVLLRPGGWLNDRVINFALRYYEHDCEPKISDKVLLMDPAVVSYLRIQCEDEDDYVSLARGNQLGSRRLIILPCSDSLDFETPSTHWSVVIYSVDADVAVHLDSCNNHNSLSALDLLESFAKLLRYGCEQSVMNVHYRLIFFQETFDR
jgi:Ulp1 family protease